MGHAQLPSSLQPDTWRRLITIPRMLVCQEVFIDPPVIDLATPNTHLLHSEVMRWILAGIMNLYHMGQAHHIELEGEDEAFYIHSYPWKPWHHIYSKNKVTKHSYRKPEANLNGLYIVRLFYMGCWRRITVDDYLPLDSERRPLLPMTATGQEMWPALLTKALLKVASLSWTEDKEIQDFSVMACLTGWHAQELDLHEVPSRTIWWLCQKLLMSNSDDVEDRFTGVKDLTVGDFYETSSTARESILCPNWEPAFTCSSGEVLGSVFLCAVVHTLPAELSPCVEHPILITEAKIDPYGEIRPPTPLWKTFRWKKWAREQGIIAETSENFVKCIRMFSSLHNCLPNMNPVARIPSMRDLVQESRTDRKYALRSTYQSKDKFGDLRSKSNISRKFSKYEKMKEDTSQDTVFPEMWIKFEKIVHCIKRFEIYYKTKSFQHNLKVTDVSEIRQQKRYNVNKKNSNKETKSSLTSIVSSQNTQQGKTDVLYLLMDSVACKKLIISLSVLKPGVNVPGQSYQPESKSTPAESRDNGANTDPPPIMYYILGETYDCQSNQIQDIKFAIKTVATTCHLVQLNEGLTVFRLWFKLPEVYAIRISSQMPFILGNREEIQDTLTSESVSWKQYGYNFSSAFNALSDMQPHSPLHQELLENLHKSFLPPFIPTPSSHFAANIKRKIHSKFEVALISLLLEKTDDIDKISKIISEWQWMFRRDKFGSRISIQNQTGYDIEIRSTSILDGDKGNSEMKISEIIEESEESPSVDGNKNQDSYYKYPTPASKENKLISFDQESGIEFLRRMLENDPELIKYYPFRNDDKNRICFTDYNGVISNVTWEWIPLVRFVVNSHSNTFPHCALYLSTSLPYGVIELINNDTLEHFPRHSGDIEPSYIPANRHGYTVFAYGKVEGQNSKFHSWRIRFVSAAQEEPQLPHACSWVTTNECLPQQPPQLSIKEIKGNYIPKKDNMIFKCTLTLEKTQNLTVRAVMSNNDAEFALRIRDEDGDVIADYHACGELVVPVVQLKGSDFNGLGFYVIEAQVLHDTWILTAEELKAVDTAINKAQQSQLMYIEQMQKKGVSISSALNVRQSTKSKRSIANPHRPPPLPINLASNVIANAPQWKLMIVVDKELSSTVTIKQDHRRWKEIQEIKNEWELANPGRYLKSYKIRQLFLDQKLYSPYLANYIHEQGVGPGEKTKYLLQYLSFKETDQLDTYRLYRPVYQQKMSKKKRKEFRLEYKGMRKKFKDIKLKQVRNQILFEEHLSQATYESGEMITQAYMKRDSLVEQLEPQLRVSTVSRNSRRESSKSKRYSRI